MLITTQLRACCWSLFVNGSTHLTLLYVDHYTTDSLLLATFCQRLHTSDITYVDHYTTDSLLLVMFCWQLHTSDIALCLSLHNREPAVGHFLSMASHIWHCFMLITTQPTACCWSRFVNYYTTAGDMVSLCFSTLAEEIQNTTTMGSVSSQIPPLTHSHQKIRLLLPWDSPHRAVKGNLRLLSTRVLITYFELVSCECATLYWQQWVSQS